MDITTRCTVVGKNMCDFPLQLVIAFSTDVTITDTAQVALRNLATLIESQKSVEALTAALDALNHELDKYELQESIGGGASNDITALYAAANTLQEHNQESIMQLHDLMANLGLLQMPLPKSLPACDEEFVKHLILLHAMKMTLWS
jgi:hypothetical protein